QREAVECIDAMHQLVLNLLGESGDPALHEGASFDINEALPRHQAMSSKRLVLYARSRQAMLLHAFDRPDAPLAHMDAINPDLAVTSSIFEGMYLHFQDAMIRLAVVKGSRGLARRRLLRQVGRDRHVLARWARIAPMNAAGKLHLLDAELYRVRGDEAGA